MSALRVVNVSNLIAASFESTRSGNFDLPSSWLSHMFAVFDRGFSIGYHYVVYVCQVLGVDSVPMLLKLILQLINLRLNPLISLLHWFNRCHLISSLDVGRSILIRLFQLLLSCRVPRVIYSVSFLSILLFISLIDSLPVPLSLSSDLSVVSLALRGVSTPRGWTHLIVRETNMSLPLRSHSTLGRGVFLGRRVVVRWLVPVLSTILCGHSHLVRLLVGVLVLRTLWYYTSRV